MYEVQLLDNMMTRITNVEECDARDDAMKYKGW